MTAEGFMEDFCKVTETRTADGLGSVLCQRTDGEKIIAGVSDVQETSTEVGGSKAVRQQVTIYLPKEVSLSAGDVIRRECDGALFRLTGFGKEAPDGTMKMRQVTAERVVFPWRQ
jgi:hypothetical protein